MSNIIKLEELENKLISYKNQLVLIDSDVAELYGVETKDINKAVKNNPDKFPDGYILELTKEEKNEVVEIFHHLSRNINNIMKTEDENLQKSLAQESNQILEDIIEIDTDVIADDEDGEVIETTTKFEFNLGFAKVSKSVKKIKK